MDLLNSSTAGAGRGNNGHGRYSRRPLILLSLLVICSVIYYFGELATWAGWVAVRQQFFYGVHDVHRLLFLAPILYAAHVARVKGALIITLVAFIIFLPRAFLISPFPDPLLRMVLFTIFAGAIGILTAVARNKADRCWNLEIEISAERDKLLKILDSTGDGILITGPDYKIRFMNAPLIKSFGNGTGFPCYRHLNGLDTPCKKTCHIPEVIKGEKVERWECGFPNGTRYEVVAAPFVDTDGTLCQLSVFRKVTSLIPSVT
jgi:hypothetical protein